MPEKLLRAAIPVQAADVERAIAAFELAGVFDSAVEWEIGEPVEEPSWGRPAPLPERAEVAAYLPPRRWNEIAADFEAALAQLWSPGSAPTPAVSKVPQRDWRTAWHEHFGIVRIRAGRGIAIRPPHLAYEPSDGEVVIDLAPGLAFGTGQHQSTRLALALLAEAMAEHTARNVLDLGTGSGILAVAAAKLGAETVTAVDIDPIAVEAARDAARRNGVAHRVQVLEGSVPAGAQYDLVLANLTADLLQGLAEEIAAAAASGGRVIVSGFLTARSGEVVEALAQVGLRVVRTRIEDEWSAALAVARTAG